MDKNEHILNNRFDWKASVFFCFFFLVVFFLFSILPKGKSREKPDFTNVVNADKKNQGSNLEGPTEGKKVELGDDGISQGAEADKGNAVIENMGMGDSADPDTDVKHPKEVPGGSTTTNANENNPIKNSKRRNIADTGADEDIAKPLDSEVAEDLNSEEIPDDAIVVDEDDSGIEDFLLDENVTIADTHKEIRREKQKRIKLSKQLGRIKKDISKTVEQVKRQADLKMAKKKIDIMKYTAKDAEAAKKQRDKVVNDAKNNARDKFTAAKTEIKEKIEKINQNIKELKAMASEKREDNSTEIAAGTVPIRKGRQGLGKADPIGKDMPGLGKVDPIDKDMLDLGKVPDIREGMLDLEKGENLRKGMKKLKNVRED
jgi:hypothetical protein